MGLLKGDTRSLDYSSYWFSKCGRAILKGLKEIVLHGE